METMYVRSPVTVVHVGSALVVGRGDAPVEKQVYTVLFYVLGREQRIMLLE